MYTHKHNTHTNTTHTQTAREEDGWDHVTALGSDADFGVSINVGDTAFQQLLNAHACHACPKELTDLLNRQHWKHSNVGEEEHGAEGGLEFVRQRHEPQ